MANSTDAEATLKKFVARINAHDPSGIIALCTIDHVFIDSLGSKLSGHKQLEQGWSGDFPCFRITASRWSQRFLAARSFSLAVSPRRRTRHRRRLGAFHPRGARVEDERIAEWQVYADNKPVYELLSHHA